MTNLYQHAGGDGALHRLEEVFNSKVLADPVLQPDDEPFRQAVRSHVEFGTHVAQQNSHAKTDADLHPLRNVPRWTWPEDADGAPMESER